ncbi:hypothetical protein BHM03_00056978 [Ensete ventricosum]|nr:hypothetical protein BHM03_00056978 [Ensete ventricosum]
MPAPGTLEKKNGEARASHLEAATGSLNSTQMEIFLQIQEKDLLQVPNPIETRSEEQDRRCYCRFHHSYGHDTEESFTPPNSLVEKQIDIIISGPTSRGDNSSACKTYTRAMVEKRPKHERDSEITFRSGEEEYPDHDDALISTQIANA